jgi:hypothetical protein
MGNRRNCAYCRERAVAFRIEPGGNKTFLCYDHIPISTDLETQPARHEGPLEVRARRARGLLRYYAPKK